MVNRKKWITFTLACAIGLFNLGTLTSAPANATSCPRIKPNGQPTLQATAKVNWSGCNLTGIKLSGKVFTEANFSNAILKNADFSRSVVSVVNFSHSNLTNSNFSNANLYLANFTNANLSNSNFKRAFLNGHYDKDIFNRMGRVTPDFGSANLSQANFAYSKLCYAQTPGGYGARGPGFEKANLTSANFKNSDLCAARLNQANLTSTNLTNSNLQLAVLEKTKILDAKLVGAKITTAFTHKLNGRPNSLPRNVVLRAGMLFGPNISIIENHEFGVDITGIDLSSLNLSGSQFLIDVSGVDFSNSNLTNANFGFTWFLGCKNSKFNRANLTNVTFNCNLSGANLTGANISGTTIFDSDGDGVSQFDLSSVTATSLTGTPASLPDGWSVQNGTFFKSP